MGYTITPAVNGIPVSVQFATEVEGIIAQVDYLVNDETGYRQYLVTTEDGKQMILPLSREEGGNFPYYLEVKPGTHFAARSFSVPEMRDGVVATGRRYFVSNPDAGITKLEQLPTREQYLATQYRNKPAADVTETVNV